MARARNIKPSLFKNELLGVADPLLTILFTSLWCLADKEGRLEDRPLRIKAETFPYREGLDVNGYLTELQTLGFIHRYSVKGVRLIQVTNFRKHQAPHHTEKESEYPGFELDDGSAPCEETKQPLTPKVNGETPVALALIPDSLIPDSLNSVAKATGGTPPNGQLFDFAKHVDELTKKELWDYARAMFAEEGKVKDPRALIGKLCGQYTDDLVMDALRRMIANPPVDLVPWLTATCQTLAGSRAKGQKQSRHNGFDAVDYSEGVENGRIV